MLHNVKIYNTLSNRKEKIRPLQKNKLNLFVCGPTVYDFSHLGHARTYIIFDSFVKYLKHKGFKVFYLQNVTDIDDKIILRAQEKGVLPEDLALAFEKEYLETMKMLSITSVSKYARATDYIKEIINQVARLIEKGYAYKLDNGIYFDVGKFKDYGKLSRRTVLQAEDSISRIDYAKDKKNRGDFCLWKIKAGEKGPNWDSPFGAGRPGWHIEDTAITEKFFGAQYDIHGGGRDLTFPHHEAEIAQMEAVSGKKPMAKIWMHTGFLTINGQKMSKSLNNSILISNFLGRHSVWQLRFWIVKNLWRSPIDYSDSTMSEVKQSLERIGEFLRKIREVKVNKHKKVIKNLKVNSFVENFYRNLDDDFNTPKAFAEVFKFIKETNKLLDKKLLSKKNANEIFTFFKDINSIFNIIDFANIKQQSIPAKVKKLVKDRENYRKNKEWEKADMSRREIEKYGYLVEDKDDGPALRKI